MEESRYKLPEHKQGMTIQMLQQQQQQPATIQRKPVLLNGQIPQMFNHQGTIMDNIPKTVHTLVSHDSTGVHFQTPPVNSQSTVLQFQQKPQDAVSTTTVSNLWLLVEWEADGENIYHVINAAELIGNNSGTIQTGKSVWFKNGSVIIQATIVLISDDKVYIDRELNDLRKMAAQNLADNNKKRINGRSTSTNGNSQKDKTIVPRSSSQIKQDARTGFSKPMTFDQQTQTDTRLSVGNGANANNEELVQKMNEMMSKQEQTSKMLEKLMTQVWSLFDQTSANNRTVNDLQTQLTRIEGNLKMNTSEADILIPKPVEEQKTEFIFYDNQNESNMSKANSEGNLVIAEYEHGANGELIKRPTSRVSYTNDATNQSAFSTDGSEFILTESRANSTVITLNTSKNTRKSDSKRRSNSNSNISIIMDDWKDEESDGNVSIGPNRTKVPSGIYHAIDWGSYKAATRKLLVTLFPREVLATHSLTGRPSPAFHDRNRPAKDRLDQKIITDIVYSVTKHCDVPESLVRTAITTKCADENKMSRQRQQKRKIKDEHGDSPFGKVPHYDKENSISMSNN
ncbi:uncharacterized protein LOC134832246 [Culicoides brevitarsis]|uniref:uncharacterized protein LOC134832246 n=1 Tax=Culicoides brevitarsis TaxID=469753 RepID=UPI00307C8BA9